MCFVIWDSQFHNKSKNNCGGVLFLIILLACHFIKSKISATSIFYVSWWGKYPLEKALENYVDIFFQSLWLWNNISTPFIYCINQNSKTIHKYIKFLDIRVKALNCTFLSWFVNRVWGIKCWNTWWTRIWECDFWNLKTLPLTENLEDIFKWSCI